MEKIKEKVEEESMLLEKVKKRMGLNKVPVDLGDGLKLELTHLPASYLPQRMHLLGLLMKMRKEALKAKSMLDKKEVGEDEMFEFGAEMIEKFSPDDIKVIQDVFEKSLSISYPDWDGETIENLVSNYFLNFINEGIEIILPNISGREDIEAENLKRAEDFAKRIGQKRKKIKKK